MKSLVAHGDSFAKALVQFEQAQQRGTVAVSQTTCSEILKLTDLIEETSGVAPPIRDGLSYDVRSNLRPWIDGSSADADVLTIVLHELGRALGIAGHNDGDANAVMNGSCSQDLVRRRLVESDRAPMHALYASLLT